MNESECTLLFHEHMKLDELMDAYEEYCKMEVRNLSEQDRNDDRR